MESYQNFTNENQQIMNRPALKPRALKLSTNIIHNRVLKTPQPRGPLKPTISENKISENRTEQTKKIDKPKSCDENCISAAVENAYNPLKDVYGFDEELYKVVCKLELADDGLPDYKCDEPFDF